MTIYPLANLAPFDALRFAQPPSDPCYVSCCANHEKKVTSRLRQVRRRHWRGRTAGVLPSSHLQDSGVFLISAAWNADVSLKAEVTAPNVGIAVVIPCYREKAHILDVLAHIGLEVAAIYVVDDCCPDHTGDLVATECRDDRVRIIRLKDNLGVGGAVLAGARLALTDGHHIVVKVDGDGQMDPALIRRFVRPIEDGTADVTKGNRFYDADSVRSMPPVRLFGNAALSFLTKLSSGYWSIFDPTNGFIAWDSRILAAIPMEKLASRYFFESDMLFRIGLLRPRFSISRWRSPMEVR